MKRVSKPSDENVQPGYIPVEHINPSKKKINSTVSKPTPCFNHSSTLPSQRQRGTKTQQTQTHGKNVDDKLLPIRRILVFEDEAPANPLRQFNPSAVQNLKIAATSKEFSKEEKPNRLLEKAGSDDKRLSLMKLDYKQLQETPINNNSQTPGDTMLSNIELEPNSNFKPSQTASTYKAAQLIVQNKALKQNIKKYEEANKALTAKIQTIDEKTSKLSEEFKKLMSKYNEDLSKHNETLISHMKHSYHQHVYTNTLPDDIDSRSQSSFKYSLTSRAQRLSKSKQKMSEMRDRLSKMDFKEVEKILGETKRSLKF